MITTNSNKISLGESEGVCGGAGVWRGVGGTGSVTRGVEVEEGSGKIWLKVGSASKVVVGVGVSEGTNVNVGVGPVGVLVGVLVIFEVEVGETVADCTGVFVRVLPGPAVFVAVGVAPCPCVSVGVGVIVEVGVMVEVESVVD